MPSNFLATLDVFVAQLIHIFSLMLCLITHNLQVPKIKNVKLLN